MEFTPLRGKIIDAIADYPDGVSFNKLADKLKGDLSRIVLSKEIRNMHVQGFLKVLRDPGHRQRKIIALEKNLVEILSRIKNRDHEGKIGIRTALETTLKYIIEYRRIARNISNPFLKEYAKYRVLKHVEKVLEDVA